MQIKVTEPQSQVKTMVTCDCSMLKNNSEFHRREEIKKTMSAAALCELKFLRETQNAKLTSKWAFETLNLKKTHIDSTVTPKNIMRHLF